MRPHRATVEALAAEVPLIEAAGWEHALSCEIGNPYISAARATMLRKALDAKATTIMFIDHDVSWKAGDLLKLIETEGGLIAGTYRFKNDEEQYMGGIYADESGRPIVRADGALSAQCAPAGFLKVTREAVNRLMEKYPELCYGERVSPHFDLFNHGAYQHTWYGEDYACCRRWRDLGEPFWIVPDLDITHWAGDIPYPGNFHRYLLRQPGGSDSENPQAP